MAEFILLITVSQLFIRIAKAQYTKNMTVFIYDDKNNDCNYDAITDAPLANTGFWASGWNWFSNPYFTGADGKRSFTLEAHVHIWVTPPVNYGGRTCPGLGMTITPVIHREFNVACSCGHDGCCSETYDFPLYLMATPTPVCPTGIPVTPLPCTVNNQTSSMTLNWEPAPTIHTAYGDFTVNRYALNIYTQPYPGSYQNNYPASGTWEDYLCVNHWVPTPLPGQDGAYTVPDAGAIINARSFPAAGSWPGRCDYTVDTSQPWRPAHGPQAYDYRVWYTLRNPWDHTECSNGQLSTSTCIYPSLTPYMVMHVRDPENNPVQRNICQACCDLGWCSNAAAPHCQNTSDYSSPFPTCPVTDTKGMNMDHSGYLVKEYTAVPDELQFDQNNIFTNTWNWMFKTGEFSVNVVLISVTPTPTPYIDVIVHNNDGDSVNAQICPACCFVGNCNITANARCTENSSSNSFPATFCPIENPGLWVNRGGYKVEGIIANPNTGTGYYPTSHDYAYAWPRWNTGVHTAEVIMITVTPPPWTQIQGGDLYSGTVDFELPYQKTLMVTPAQYPYGEGAVWSGDGVFNYHDGDHSKMEFPTKLPSNAYTYSYFNELFSKRLVTDVESQNVGQGADSTGDVHIYRYASQLQPFVLDVGSIATLDSGTKDSYIFLVNGSLQITQDMAAVSKAYVYIVNGDITLSDDVKNIYGMFISNNFNTGGGNLPLTVYGMAYTNGFTLSRDYRSYNQAAHTFVYQPKYLKVVMEYMSKSKLEWQEK